MSRICPIRHISMSSQLLTKLRTKEDLEILIGELDLLDNALYQTDKKYDDVIHNDIRSWVSEIILNESIKTEMPVYIKELKNDLANIPIISASINFEPSTSFLELISDWLKKYVNEKMVVDLLLNSSTLGGIQLSYKGKYIDLSLRKKIVGEMETVKLISTNMYQ